MSYVTAVGTIVAFVVLVLVGVVFTVVACRRDRDLAERACILAHEAGWHTGRNVLLESLLRESQRPGWRLDTWVQTELSADRLRQESLTVELRRRR